MANFYEDLLEDYEEIKALQEGKKVLVRKTDAPEKTYIISEKEAKTK